MKDVPNSAGDLQDAPGIADISSKEESGRLEEGSSKEQSGAVEVGEASDVPGDGTKAWLMAIGVRPFLRFCHDKRLTAFLCSLAVACSR